MRIIMLLLPSLLLLFGMAGISKINGLRAPFFASSSSYRSYTAFTSTSPGSTTKATTSFTSYSTETTTTISSGQLSYSSFASSPSYPSWLLSAYSSSTPFIPTSPGSTTKATTSFKSYSTETTTSISLGYTTTSTTLFTSDSTETTTKRNSDSTTISTTLFTSDSTETTTSTTSDCGGYYRSRTGTISHPPNAGNYSDNEECIWIIYTDLIIIFTRFDTEEGSDFLYIRDGNSSTSPLIGNYSGVQIPLPVQATSNVIFVHFSSDSSVVESGFKLQWGFSNACSYKDTIYQSGDILKIGCALFFCNGLTGDFYYGGYDYYNCRSCKAYWDPHIITYDTESYWRSYSYQGCGNHSMTQSGNSYTPQFAVYAYFTLCNGSSYVTCVDSVTFKNDAHTFITIGYRDNRIILQVNGHSFNINSMRPLPVEVNSIVYPVWSWRTYQHYSKCISLYGSSGILITFCGYDRANELYMYAEPNIQDKVQGLCGTITENREDCFIWRDGNKECPWQEDPNKDFGLSWLASGNSSCGIEDARVKRQLSQTRCEANSTKEDNFYNLCNSTINGYASSEPGEVETLINDCLYDLCHVDDPDDWLRGVQETVEVLMLSKENIATTVSPTTTAGFVTEPRCEKGIFQGGWKGKCFGTQHTLYARDRCDSIIYDNTTSGCPADENGLAEACCIDCSKQNRICNRRHRGSIGHNRPCCSGFLEMNTPRQGSGCVCCKKCQPRAWCRRHRGHHHCITKHDPHYNRDWCFRQGNWTGRIFKRQCKGRGCGCCIWD